MSLHPMNHGSSVPITNMQRDGGTERQTGESKIRRGTTEKKKARERKSRLWQRDKLMDLMFGSKEMDTHWLATHAFPACLSFLLNTKQLLEQRECAAAAGRVKASPLGTLINNSTCVYVDSKSIRKLFDQKWTWTEPVIQSITSDLYSSCVCKWFVKEKVENIMVKTTEQLWFVSCICIHTSE